uniref:hypothetical protein n=1 Tax=Alistipes sp. TaxID=1872444 RepID=UPI0040564162
MIKKAFYILTAVVAMCFTSCEKCDHAIADPEKDFANRIQSLIFVPQYSDGKILMDYSIRGTRVHFRISPAEIAEVITTDNVKAFARYTDDPTTRASYNPEFPLSVISVLGDETGMLEVNIAESTEHQLSTEFWQGVVECIIYIQITDEYGNNAISETIPMVAYNDVRNSSEVAIAKFKHYFCDSNGNMAILPLDEFSRIWAVGVTTGEKVCEIFSDITGLDVPAQESYTYSYQSEDGSVELRITG